MTQVLALGCRDPVERIDAVKSDDPHRRQIVEHEQGIRGIGTMGSSPMPPMVPMVYRNAKVGHEPSTLRPDRGDRLGCDRGVAVGARRLGWPVAVTTPWGNSDDPGWLSWIACAAAILLAWSDTPPRGPIGIKPVTARTARQGMPPARRPLVRIFGPMRSDVTAR